MKRCKLEFKFLLGGTISTEKQQHQLYLTKENSNGQRYNTASDNEKIYYQNQFQFNELSRKLELGLLKSHTQDFPAGLSSSLSNSALKLLSPHRSW